MDPIETFVTYERSTKGTHFFKEDDVFDEPAIRSIYITRGFFNGEEPPKRLKVTIEEVDAE